VIDPLILGIIGAVFLGSIYIFHKMMRARQELQDWDPFGFNEEMWTELVCKSCGIKFSREWHKGDFIFGESHEPCPCVCKKKRCEGPLMVTAVYWKRKKTPEEIKWEKLEAKWR
jgi:hypothetical protein